MKCPKCGSENKEDAVYCDFCQEILKKKIMVNEFGNYTVNNEIKKTRAISGYIFLIVIAVLITGIYFYPKFKANRVISDYVSKNNNEFTQNVIQSELPVLVDFFATWCPPCQAMAPIVEELKIEYANKIVVYKINTDENQDLVSLYDISGIPTFIFFKKGKVVDRIVGSAPKELLKSKIDQIL